jgi:predicted NodU family carbamoyl transferase
LSDAFGENDAAIHYVEHHLGHAASAYYASPFESAAILTLDGTGESTTTMASYGEGNRIRVLNRVKLPHSLGQFYSAATNFLGFDMFQGDEYKVMGMAAYGEPEYYDFLRNNVLVANGSGTFHLDISYMDHHLAKHHEYPEKITSVFGAPRGPDEEITQRHYNVAASVQKALEETVLHILIDLKKRTGEKRLCLAGGVALNSVMNGRILRESPFDELFIQPAANDADGALGSALYVLHHKLNEPRRYTMRDAYLGPSYSTERCIAAARAKKLVHEELPRKSVARTAAQALADGKILAWFQGRMEFGPRALGHRSFLADPRNGKMKEILNERIKQREPFRPFAPSMLEEATPRYFSASVNSPYMLLVLPVSSDKRDEIPAVVHVDGTARPQTVSKPDLTRPEAASDGNVVLVGIRGEITALISGHIRAGYASQSFTQGATPQSFRGFVADGRLAREFGTQTSLVLNFGRKTNPSAFQESGFYTSSYGTARFVAPVIEKMRFTATVSYFGNRYPLSDVATDSNRLDRTLSNAVGISYFFTPLSFFSIDYRRDRRQSSLETLSYSNNAVQFMIGFGFLNR